MPSARSGVTVYEATVSTVRFQDQLGQALRKVPGAYVYHPPDGVAAQWKPGDWIFGYHKRWGIVEAKQTRTRTFVLALWTPQQRAFCKQVIAAGGEYWLVVSWRGAQGTRTPETITIAYHGEHVLAYGEAGHKSLTTENSFGIVVPWVRGGYDVGVFL